MWILCLKFPVPFWWDLEQKIIQVAIIVRSKADKTTTEKNVEYLLFDSAINQLERFKRYISPSKGICVNI